MTKLTEAQKKIIDKHIDEIFKEALVETFNWFLETDTFFHVFPEEYAIDCKSSIEAAHALVIEDVQNGEQYFYTRLEEKLKGMKIEDLTISW